MRIVFYVSHFYLYVIELANALSKERNIQVFLLISTNVEKQHLKLIDKEIKVFFFKDIDFVSFRQNIKWLKQIRKLLVEIKPDIVHVQSYGHRWFHWLFLSYPRYKLFNTVHDPNPHSGDINSLKGLALMRQCIQVLPSLTKGTFVHGETLRTELLKQKKYDSKDVFVIPHGEFSIYKHLASEANELKVPKKSILFFGRIWPYKGLDIFLEAAKLVLNRYPKQVFVVAGKGEDITPYLKQVEQQRQSFVFYNFRIPDEQVDELFQNCLFTVLPYKDATQSGVVPIAFAYSKPAIATYVGALPEVVFDGVNGVLVPPNNFTILAEAMIKLLDNPHLLDKLSKGAMDSAKNDISWNKIAQNVLSVYKKYV